MYTCVFIGTFAVCFPCMQIFYSRVQLRNISLVYNPMPIANITAQYPFLDGVSFLYIHMPIMFRRVNVHFDNVILSVV